MHLKTEGKKWLGFYARIYASCNLLDVGQINGIFHWYCPCQNALVYYNFCSVTVLESISKQQRFSAVMHGAIILIVCRLTFSLSRSPRESCFFSNAWFLPIGPQGLTWNNSRFILNLSIQQSVAFLMRLSCDIEKKKTSYFFLYNTFSEKIFTIINVKYPDSFKMHTY